MAKSTQRGLGRGFGALFPDPVEESPQNAPSQLLPLRQIEPNRSQPRQSFDEDALAELADSIAAHGLLQPIAVRQLDNGSYQIIAGERRWRAARMAGLQEVPVHIMTADDAEAAQLALIENLQREDLNPMEEASGYESLIRTYGLSQEEAAQRIGKSRPAVTNALRLLKLSPAVREMVEQGTLSAGHARTLLGLEDPEAQAAAAQTIIRRELTVRQAEQLVKRLRDNAEKPAEPEPDILQVDYYKECEQQMSRDLGRRVSIQRGRKKGTLQLEYYGDEDLQLLLDALSGISGSLQRKDQ